MGNDELLNHVQQIIDVLVKKVDILIQEVRIIRNEERRHGTAIAELQAWRDEQEEKDDA